MLHCVHVAGQTGPESYWQMKNLVTDECKYIYIYLS